MLFRRHNFSVNTILVQYPTARWLRGYVALMSTPADQTSARQTSQCGAWFCDIASYFLWIFARRSKVSCWAINTCRYIYIIQNEITSAVRSRIYITISWFMNAAGSRLVYVYRSTLVQMLALGVASKEGGCCYYRLPSPFCAGGVKGCPAKWLCTLHYYCSGYFSLFKATTLFNYPPFLCSVVLGE